MAKNTQPTDNKLRAEILRLGITVESAGCSTEELISRARTSGDPLGYLYSQPENARLRRELEQANGIRTNLEGDVAWEQREKGRIGAELRATKGVVTKIRRRVANGVCPCCKRHFVNLKRHMSGQHPEFAGTTESEQSRPQATKPKSSTLRT